jgi:RND family efflux transporter MFP subunit
VVETSVSNSRLFSGEVMPIPGKMITITAPVAGTLMASGRNITAGSKVVRGQQLFRLLIMPSENLISAQEELAQRQVQYATTSEKVKRTTRMYEEKSGSLRAKQEAEAELAAINAQLRVARGRVELLRGNPSSATSRLSTMNMEAPISGTVLKLYSTPSQVLSASAPIMDIVQLNPLWVRVPLYAGDESRIEKGGTATIQNLSGGSGNTIRAKAVTGPQTSDPLATSIDLYYEIDNSKGELRPGQKVSVTLPFSGTASGIIIPFSAIVYDIQGSTWVYTNPSPNTYVRQRVELQTVIDNKAVMTRGPKAGTKIVTVGAAELFGTEFGGGK